MKYIFKTSIFLFFLINLSLTNFANSTEQIDKKIQELEKIIGSSLKTLIGKSLKKEDTKKFLSKY